MTSLTHMATQSIPTVSCLSIRNASLSLVPTPSVVHSNGFSLVRKVFDIEHADLTLPVEELGGRSLGEVLLTPTRIYVKPVLALLEQVPVRGISHITGGGFYENIPRSIPEGLCARIRRALRFPASPRNSADSASVSCFSGIKPIRPVYRA